MSSQRAQLIQLIDQGEIPKNSIPDAVAATDVQPDSDAWRGFVDQLLLWLGALAVSFAVLFFIAYNWNDLGRYAKFGLLEFLIVAAVFLYWKQKYDSVTGKASLLAATIFLGVLLALYGQTYQTGADPWQLFFTWALLMMPWAFVARFAAIWIVWLGLINISIVLYQRTFFGFFWIVVRSEAEVAWLIFVLNTIALLCWEFLASSYDWLSERWAIRLVALASGMPITWLVLMGIFDSDVSIYTTGIMWIAWLAAMFLVYRILRPDLFMLAGLCLSGIVIVIAFFAKHMLDEDIAGSFLFLSFLIIALGTSAAVWLRKVHREIQT